MAGQTTSSKALIYFSERVEDATEAVKGLIGGSGSSKYLDTSDEKTSVIRSQLESDRDDLRLEGLRTITALISKGRDGSAYFPHVLKLTSNSNLEIRKLVYIIVRRYAKRQPDVALLGINSFQRDLMDRSEVVRAMALRVLSGLRLALVASVVEVAIAKCVKDGHFYVRKAAALAIIKCHSLSADSRPALKVHLSTLLNDRNPAVLSTSLVAHSAICPLDFALLHSHYRKLCHALSDMDEWGQRNAIEVLGLYAKRCIAKPSGSEKMDPDLELLLAKVEDLLMSRNAAVVTAAIRVIYHLAPESRHSVIARPLVRLVASTPDIAYFALVNCHLLSLSSPSLLAPHIASFLLRSSLQEPGYVSCLKLKILVQLSDSSSSEMVLSELSEQARFNSSEPVAETAVEQVGVLASKDASKNTQACTMELLKLLKECSDRDDVVGKAVSVLRRLMDSCSSRDVAVLVSRLSALLFSPPSKKNTVAAPAKKVKLVGKGSVKSGLARGCIYWLLGQHCRLPIAVKVRGDQGETALSLAHVLGSDVLRRAASNFAKEEAYAKLQIISLSAKLYTFLPTTGFEHTNTLKLLHSYILQLARYDENFDVRDRGRFCKALTDRFDVGINEGSSGERVNGKGVEGEGEEEDAEQLGGVILRRNQVLHILFEGKASFANASVLPTSKERDLNLDSLSYMLGDERGSGKGLLMEKDKDVCRVDWAAKEDLPPTSVREPTNPIQGPSAAQSASSHLSAPQRSIIREATVADSKLNGISTPPSQYDSDHSAAKYKDLDTFLDEESEEEELVQPASETESSEEDEEEDGEDGEDEGESEDEEEEESSSSGSDDSSDKAESSTRLVSIPAEENEWAR